MNEVQVFDNEEFGSIRAIRDEDGEPSFVAKDVAKALGYRMASDMTRRLDEDEKGTRSVRTPGGDQEMAVITEAGLYAAVLGSKVPEAKAFKRWVTHEVLPALRRDGGYMVERHESPEETMARTVLLAQTTIDRQKARIAELAKMIRQNGVPMGQNRLFELLRQDGYLGKTGSNRNVPTQRSMEMGLFRIKETAVTHSDGHVTLSRTPKATGRGQRYFIERYGDAGLAV